MRRVVKTQIAAAITKNAVVGSGTATPPSTIAPAPLPLV